MVLKTEIDKAIKEQKVLISRKSFGIKRLDNQKVGLSKTYVLIITGIRRCGKSTLMNQIRKRVSGTVSYFNFEDPRISGFETGDFPKLTEILGNTRIYFFDEIQNVKGWELFIRHLHDQQKMICIIGSNASLLSKELGTKLTGRNLQVELFPFSYEEYCQFTKLKPGVVSFSKYLEEGGFPDYLKTKQKEYLQQLFRDIVYRDIIVRHGIRNAQLLVDLALYLISNAGKDFSHNNLKKVFGVGSTNSITDYVQWLEDAYLIFTIPRFSWSLKSMAVNPKKVYCIDTGFAQANSLSFTDDQGRLLENAVFLALRRKHKEIFYFKEKGECDFVVREGKKVTIVLQVCYAVDSDNLYREIDGLFEALTFFNLKKGTIVTLNQKDHLEKAGKKIELVPVYEWLKKL